MQKFCEDRVIVWYINVIDIITIRSFLFRCATTWSQRLRWKENSENQPDWVYGSARSGDCHWYPQNRSEAATDRRLRTKTTEKTWDAPYHLRFTWNTTSSHWHPIIGEAQFNNHEPVLCVQARTIRSGEATHIMRYLSWILAFVLS